MDEQISLQELMDLNVAVPRYTSYPTANLWEKHEPEAYLKQLNQLKDNKSPISLYVHIPFCRSMCLYCACSVILNRRADKQEVYVQYLLKEIKLLGKLLNYKPLITQLHFGGGTPTSLSLDQFERIFKAFDTYFTFDKSQELSIEIDPRTVVEDQGDKLKGLYNLGFNRVSFGLQDSNPDVQEAVKRHQSWEMSETTYHHARELGFKEINVDLIYGLPKQNLQSFAKTTEDILSLMPDRIALFSYAKVPWLKPIKRLLKKSNYPLLKKSFLFTSMLERFFKKVVIQLLVWTTLP